MRWCGEVAQLGKNLISAKFVATEMWIGVFHNILVEILDFVCSEEYVGIFFILLKP